MSRRSLLLILALAAIAGGAAWASSRENPGRLDLFLAPKTVFVTIPFDVGATYTLGEGFVPLAVPRPVVITAIEIVHRRGVEVLGVGAYEPNPDSISLVPGWPPEGKYPQDIQDPTRSQLSWPSDVHTVIGLRTIEAKSGLRGIDIRWVDGFGETGGTTFDLAVVTCAPGACEVDSAHADPILKELGLLQ